MQLEDYNMLRALSVTLHEAYAVLSYLAEYESSRDDAHKARLWPLIVAGGERNRREIFQWLDGSHPALSDNPPNVPPDEDVEPERGWGPTAVAIPVRDRDRITPPQPVVRNDVVFYESPDPLHRETAPPTTTYHSIPVRHEPERIASEQTNTTDLPTNYAWSAFMRGVVGQSRANSGNNPDQDNIQH
jgi:hypothetical protein